MSLVVGDQDDQRRESKKENLYEFVQASGILYGALAQLEVPSTDNLTPVAGRRSLYKMKPRVVQSFKHPEYANPCQSTDFW